VPILEAENKDLFDTDSDSGSSEDEDEIGGDEPDEKVLSDDEGAKPNLSDSEEEEGKKKTNRKMKKTKKTKKKAMTAAVPLKCSHQQAIKVIEEWLVFHAWYKLGPPPVVSSTSDEEIKNLQTSIRKMLARLQVFYPRTKGHGWKLQKLHEMLHLVLALVEYCHATNFDAGWGERLLKDFFKELARNSQQRGQAIFTEQLAK
jgi:hypothetical protein